MVHIGVLVKKWLLTEEYVTVNQEIDIVWVLYLPIIQVAQDF